MVGHGGIVAFDERTDMRALAHAPAALRRPRELRQVLPLPDRPARARTRCSRPTQPVDRAQLEAAARDARARQPVRARRRHAGADPQPDRALPRRAGARLSAGHDRRPRRSRSPPGRPCSRPPARSAGDVPTLCFDERQAPFGACRVCLVGVEGAPGPSRRARRRAATGWRIDTAGPDRAARRRARSSSSCSPSCPSRRPRTPSWPTVARELGVDRPASSAGPATQHELRHDDRHPYLAFQHELCISCGRCVRACDEVQGAFALTATGRGFERQRHRRARRRLPRLDLRLVRCLRRHLSDRRDHRDHAAEPADEPRGERR